MDFPPESVVGEASANGLFLHRPEYAVFLALKKGRYLRFKKGDVGEVSHALEQEKRS
jgi:hypothetical protein